MVHSDDQGLVLPPKLAPYQVVIVPIYKNEEESAKVLQAAKRIRAELVRCNFRTILDEREGVSPGFKFNDWEMRGVPLRVEIGPKDLAKDTLVLARRDKPGKDGKSFITQGALAGAVGETLASIQKSLYDRAVGFRDAKTLEADNYDDFKSAVESGFAFSFWCGDPECEQKVKEETKATLRCIPIEQASRSGKCIKCGQPAGERAYFAKAY